MTLEPLKPRDLLYVRSLVELRWRSLLVNALTRSGGLCTEGVLRRHLPTSLPADGRLPVLPDNDGEPGVDGKLGGLHLKLLDIPEVLFLVLVGRLQVERPAHDLTEHALEEGIPRLPHLHLDLVDGLRGDVSLLLSLLRASEFPGRLHPEGSGADPEGIADDF